MLTDEQFLPDEIRESIKELRAAQISERTLAVLTDRILHAQEAKTTSLQMDIDRIETAINHRLDRIGDKLQADVQTRLGASNQMIVDIHTGIQEQGAALSQARAEFHHGLSTIGERMTDMDLWRVEVDSERASFRQSRDQSLEQRTRTEQRTERTEHAVTELATQFERFVQEIHTLIAQGPTKEQAERYRALLDELMRERGAGG